MIARDPERTMRLNTVLDVLRDARRRYIVYVFRDTDVSVVPFETIVEEVRKYEANGGPNAEPPPRQYVRTDLIHTQLPKLESVGFLERDPRTGTVRFHGHSLLEAWAERTRQFEVQ